eukprot:5607933-Amphidinium_carterae.1
MPECSSVCFDVQAFAAPGFFAYNLVERATTRRSKTLADNLVSTLSFSLVWRQASFSGEEWQFEVNLNSDAGSDVVLRFAARCISCAPMVRTDIGEKDCGRSGSMTESIKKLLENLNFWEHPLHIGYTFCRAQGP